MIYVIKASGTKFVKIGHAKRVDRRLYAHQVSCPHELLLLATADWPRGMESRIHNLLRRQCVRGEWFIHDEMVTQIIGLMIAGAGPGSLATVIPDQSDFVRRRMERITVHALNMRGKE